jgi:DNA-binding transcriptional regulator YdaS (Cro superfamily)
MGRIITNDRRAQIAAARAADPEAIGPILAELVLGGNIPVEAVAQMLAVHEPTVYRWMYGSSRPRDADKIAKINRLVTVLRKAQRAHDLPLEGSVRARLVATANLVMTHRPVPKPSAI